MKQRGKKSRQKTAESKGCSGPVERIKRVICRVEGTDKDRESGEVKD